MSKKKQQRNGFYYYMLDMQQDLRERGRFVPMRDMPLLAGPSWSKLSDGQKQAYNQRAKHEKRGLVQGGSSLPPAVASMPLPANREGRMDCTGVLLSVSVVVLWCCGVCVCVLEGCVCVCVGGMCVCVCWRDVCVCVCVRLLFSCDQWCQIQHHIDVSRLRCDGILIRCKVFSKQ